jgi:hypothetical protein
MVAANILKNKVESKSQLSSAPNDVLGAISLSTNLKVNPNSPLLVQKQI